MSNICDKTLAHAITVNCEEIGKGYYSEAVLINFDDIVAVDKDSVDNNIIKGITIASGKTGYSCQQLAKGAFNGSNSSLEVGDTVNTFTHQLQFRVYGGGLDQIAVINELANASLVAIVKEKGVAPEARYKIYGLNNGLTASEISREVAGDEGNIATITVEETDSFTIANIFWAEDAENTEKEFRALMGK